VLPAVSNTGSGDGVDSTPGSAVGELTVVTSGDGDKTLAGVMTPSLLPVSSAVGLGLGVNPVEPSKTGDGDSAVTPGVVVIPSEGDARGDESPGLAGTVVVEVSGLGETAAASGGGELLMLPLVCVVLGAAEPRGVGDVGLASLPLLAGTVVLP
jgi:hypothetical protein